MYRGLEKYAAIGLLLCLLFSAAVQAATAEFESRQELRYGDLLVNQETIIVPFQITLFHTQAATCTDAESLALSPLPTTAGSGFSLAQTSDETATAAETGFFQVLQAPYVFSFDQVPGIEIGCNPSWVANIGPISFAGLPAGTAMIFPDMTMVTRRINQSMPAINQTAPGNLTAGQVNKSGLTANRMNKASPAIGFDYVVDANNSKPYLPGNIMQVKTVKNERGENETVIDRVPKKYLQLYATPEEVANKTILERMWRNVHLNFQLDRAYSGETCYPDVICPMKNPLTLMKWYPTGLTVIDAALMTRPGTRIKKVMWPV